MQRQDYRKREKEFPSGHYSTSAGFTFIGIGLIFTALIWIVAIFLMK